MFTKKYSPSIKANNQLRDKVVAEINSFIYRLERGRHSSESDHEAILRIIEDLKADVEILSNTVGTGEENIGALALYRGSQCGVNRAEAFQSVFSLEV